MTDTKDFQIIPDNDDIAKMDRDLKFYPSVVSKPQLLSSEQVAYFNTHGYLKSLPVLSTNETLSVRAYFDKLLEDTIKAGGDSYSISTAHRKHGRVNDLLCHPTIVGYISDILGPNVIGWGSHLFCKMPHDGKRVAWHQDASYWTLTPSKTATVWLAIDDADIENACMKFLAGSHHHGHLTYRPSADDEGNILDQTVDDAEQYGTETVHDELTAGTISIHSDLLLHGSEANDSDRRRCGLTLRYCTPDVRAGMDWNEKGVVVAGNDEGGYWANPPRPDND